MEFILPQKMEYQSGKKNGQKTARNKKGNEGKEAKVH